MSSAVVVPSCGDEQLELTILMPCLNEAETVGECVRKAQSFLQHHGVPGEVLVSDNGSQDGSPEIARRLGARVVNAPTRGYGAALQYGTLAAGGKYVIMGDADQSYDFGELLPFLEQLRAGSDLVIGNRFRGGIRPGAMPWMNRWIGTPILSQLGRLFFHSQVRDFNCGLRGYTRAAFDKLNLRTTGMEFASEMIVKATLLGLCVTEVPATLGPDGRSRPPHLRPWRDGWRHLRFMLLYSPTWLFLLPGVLLLLIGTAFGARLQMGSWKVGPFGFDTNTMLVCSMCQVVGLQIFFFGIFTRVFAISEGLLPKTASPLDRIYKWFTLERGVLLGLVIFLVGLAKLSMAVLSWKAAYFGAMSYPESLRQVIPAVTLITVGVQVIFSSFFLSILSLPRK